MEVIGFDIKPWDIFIISVPSQLCHTSIMSLWYQTLHYYVHSKSCEAFIALFPPCPEAGQPVQARLWFVCLFWCGTWLLFEQFYINSYNYCFF